MFDMFVEQRNNVDLLEVEYGLTSRNNLGVVASIFYSIIFFVVLFTSVHAHKP